MCEKNENGLDEPVAYDANGEERFRIRPPVVNEIQFQVNPDFTTFTQICQNASFFKTGMNGLLCHSRGSGNPDTLINN